MDSIIQTVRRFNRTVTQRIGALDDRFLARGRPLGEARVLWEIGDGCDVRALRARLDLDSGYLSRLLRSLEAAGLVTTGPSAADRRVRVATPTRKGVAERKILDERSDALARALVEPLNGRQQQRLAAAMDEVERLLTAGLVEVDEVDPTGPVARRCLQHYFTELDQRFATGFDPDAALPTDASVFLVATLRGEPVGCGALKAPPRKPIEIKRMWVDPSSRGLGVGRRLLAELEQRVIEQGDRKVRLDTNGTLAEAIALYRSAGYEEVPAFNDEPHATLWFEKRLSPVGGPLPDG